MNKGNILRNIIAAAFLLLIFGGGQTARAQATLDPFVDCMERERDASGAFTGRYTIYYGYRSEFTITITLRYGSANNFFSPNDLELLNQPNNFAPGVHHRVVSVTAPLNSGVTWFLGIRSVGVSGFDINRACSGSPGANSRLITYQGKLSDGANAANGVYDLRFQLFNQATGGAARTGLITAEDVPVANGIFTVQLNLGANSLPPADDSNPTNGQTTNPIINTTTRNLPLNPAIIDGENAFFEIGVRPGNSIGAYATLAPRQPLTAVPMAMRAETATYTYRAVVAENALNATNAEQLGGTAANQFVKTNDSRLSDARPPTAGSTNYIQNATTPQASANFNVSGGTVGGTLTADKTVSNGFLARGGAPGAEGINNNGYAFSGNGGDNDSGLFSSGNGQISFYSNAVERARVTESGLQIFGTLTANTKNFKIDHPLDPLNKTLTYTSIESPDMMNIYNGNATTGAGGEATVRLPDYFEALNKDFRYQLTVIGTFAQAIVFEEIKNNQFKIKTDQPNIKVSWQVTGIRRDKFAEDNRPIVEQIKPDAEKNKCLYAPACQNLLKEQK